MIRRFVCWVMRHDHAKVFVRFLHEEGPPTILGPMDRFAAEWLIVNEIAHHPYHFKRRIMSARIIGGN